MSTFFLCTQNRKFSWNRQKIKNCPLWPRCKNRLLLATSCKYNWCLWENYMYLSDPDEYRFWLILVYKNVDAYHVSFGSKWDVIKRLSPKTMRQTTCNMKCLVDWHNHRYNNSAYWSRRIQNYRKILSDRFWPDNLL